MHCALCFLLVPATQFEDISRFSEIWEWGNYVLWPGLFGGLDPCNATVGAAGDPLWKGCNNDAYQDGEGPGLLHEATTPTHNLRGPTPIDLFELVRRLDMLDWTEGILFRTTRARQQPCDGRPQIPTEEYDTDEYSFRPDPVLNTSCGVFVPGGACDRGGEEKLFSLLTDDDNVTAEECQAACEAQRTQGCCWRRPSGVGDGACRFAPASDWYSFGEVERRSATSCNVNISHPRIVESWFAAGFAPPPPSPPLFPSPPSSPPDGYPYPPPTPPPPAQWTLTTPGRDDEPPPHLLDASLPDGFCYPELSFGMGSGAPFGVNFSHPGEPMVQPFVYLSREELGSSPHGVSSAHRAAFLREPYETGGFVALVIPFLSQEIFPEQTGNSPSEVEDFRHWYVSPENDRHNRYWCVRTSHNGRAIRQICDPTDNLRTNDGEMTGVVRAHVEQFWGDLKRGHFLDSQTRSLTITMQLKNNNNGIAYRLTLMFEQTASGTVLPSYHVQTRMLSLKMSEDMAFYARVSLFTVIMFIVLEVIRIARAFSHGWAETAGLRDYFTDIWNVADWLNFVLYGFVWLQIRTVRQLQSERDCSSYLCTEVGYFDDWELMDQVAVSRRYFAMNICIQMLKVVKFTSTLVPKMSLATDTLRQCLSDLIFFGMVISITVLAFSNMLYIQLGPFMMGYSDQMTAIVTLLRAVFNDFDIDAVMAESQGYTNALLLLFYLFVAIFIIFSIFLSILSEAEVQCRLETIELKAQDPKFNDLGTLATLWGYFENLIDCIMHEFEIKNPWPDSDSGEDATDSEEEEERLRQIGALRLERVDPYASRVDWETVADLRQTVVELRQHVEVLAAEVSSTVDDLEQEHAEAVANEATHAAAPAPAADHAEDRTAEQAAAELRQAREMLEALLLRTIGEADSLDMRIKAGQAAIGDGSSMHDGHDVDYTADDIVDDERFAERLIQREEWQQKARPIQRGPHLFPMPPGTLAAGGIQSMHQSACFGMHSHASRPDRSLMPSGMGSSPVDAVDPHQHQRCRRRQFVRPAPHPQTMMRRDGGQRWSQGGRGVNSPPPNAYYGAVGEQRTAYPAAATPWATSTRPYHHASL